MKSASSEPAVLQIALVTDEPSRIFVDGNFTVRTMPAESTGHPRAERISRIATAPQTSAAPNTEFIYSFNADLVPGIEMHGGYALYIPVAGSSLICTISTNPSASSAARRPASSSGVVERRRYAYRVVRWLWCREAAFITSSTNPLPR